MKLYIKRIIAYAIDYALTSLLMFIYYASAQLFYHQNDINKGILMLVCALVTLFFLTTYIPTKTNGQTIGKMIIHITVINNNKKAYTYTQSFFRECIIKISFAPMFIPVSLVYHLIFNVIIKHDIYGKFIHDDLLHTSVIDKVK